MENQNSTEDIDSTDNKHCAFDLSLDQVNLNIGDPIKLQIGSESCIVRLIGYLKDKSFIVSMPDGVENPIHPEMGQSIGVRFSCDNRSFVFNSVINHATADPFPCLYLAYPCSIQPLQERLYDRVRVNITGVVYTADDESTPCVVHEISIGGALIELNAPQGEVNDPLRLILRVEINGAQFELTLDSKIRSVRLGESGANILHGLAFHDLSEKDILALSAFDLFPEINPHR